MFLLTVNISNKIPHESLFKRRNQIITKKSNGWEIMSFFVLVDNKQNLSNQTAGSETISSI